VLTHTTRRDSSDKVRARAWVEQTAGVTLATLSRRPLRKRSSTRSSTQQVALEHYLPLPLGDLRYSFPVAFILRPDPSLRRLKSLLMPRSAREY
jgi:hypothetical protein